MSGWLLDVSALLALLDPEHTGNEAALSWFAANRSTGWTTCPLTENAFVRIVSHPAYTHTVTPAVAISTLREATLSEDHRRWADDVSILDPDVIDHTRLHGPGQLTDVYLLALAVKHDGCFVTFDRSVPLSTVRGAEQRHLLVL